MSQLDEQQPPRAGSAIVSGVVFAILIFSFGYLIGLRGYFSRNVPDALTQFGGANIAQPRDIDFGPVWKAWHIIDDKFVPAAVATSSATTTTDANKKRVWGMIQGLAASLDDPYTFFLPPAENKLFEEDISGSFEGVGMEIAVRDEVLTVVSPLKGSPAERAGLKSGDRILKINGEDTRGLDVTEAVKRIRGKGGTAVKLSVLRDGWDAARDFEIVREVINVPIITTEDKGGGVHLIELSSFTSTSPDEFRRALRRFVQSGNTKLIVDLRGNPGGYLEAAVDTTSWFLPLGSIVVTEDYAGNRENIVHRSRGYDIFNENLKMVILINKGSASASEIMAAALRHWGKAKLVGEPTFGKGSVQELIEITSDTALKITVARWLSPDGMSIPMSGIVPDVEVKLTEKDAEEGKDPQMDKAIELLAASD